MIGKEKTCIKKKKKKKELQSTQGAYKGHQQHHPKKKGKKKEGLTKNNTPQRAPIQSTKSTIEEKLRAINNLDHAQRLQRKTSLIPWLESSLLSNTTITFLPDYLKNIQRSYPPNFFPFPTHKWPVPTWEHLSH